MTDYTDDPPVKNVLGAISQAMDTEDDAYRQSDKSIDRRNGLAEAEQEIVDTVLIHICGWSFPALLEKADFLTPGVDF